MPVETADLTKSTAAAGGPCAMRRAVWIHLVKDLRIEWRSREAINSMLFFALLVVVLFSAGVRPARIVFARDCRRRDVRGHAVCQRERAEPGVGAGDSSPGAGRAADGADAGSSAVSGQGAGEFSLCHHCAGAAGSGVSLSFTTCALRATHGCWQLVLPLGTWALVANGTFFAALAIRSRNREMLLPLILFPIFMPALLAMVVSTPSILTGRQRPIAVDQDASWDTTLFSPL